MRVDVKELVSRLEVLRPTLNVPALGEVAGNGGCFSEEFGGVLGVAVEFEQVRAGGSLPLPGEWVVSEAVQQHISVTTVHRGLRGSQDRRNAAAATGRLLADGPSGTWNTGTVLQCRQTDAPIQSLQMQPCM
jgi:hypothetical protein